MPESSNGVGHLPGPSAPRPGGHHALRAVEQRSRRVSAAARRVRAALALIVITPQLTGCYTVRPVAGAEPESGTQLIAEVTDRGRAALGEMLGPGALRVHGRLASRTDSILVLNVSRVDYVSGQQAFWTGERVSLDRDHIARLNERRLSRSRSWLTLGVVTAGIAALVATISLLGDGWGGGSDGPGPGPRPT